MTVSTTTSVGALIDADDFSFDLLFDFDLFSNFALACSFARAGAAVKAASGQRVNDSNGKNRSVDVIKRPFKLKVIRLFKAQFPGGISC